MMNEEVKQELPTVVKFDDGETPISSLAEQSKKAPTVENEAKKPQDSPSNIDDEAFIAKML
jgi:hypothetical protein